MFGYQDHDRLAPGVRSVDTAIGTDEAVPRFRNQHPGRLADDPDRLRKYDLYVTWVEADSLTDIRCPRGGVHSVELHHPALGLRDHLLGDDDNVTHLEGHAESPEALHDEVRQGCALDDLREPGYGIDRDRTQARGGRPASARSVTPSSS